MRRRERKFLEDDDDDDEAFEDFDESEAYDDDDDESLAERRRRRRYGSRRRYGRRVRLRGPKALRGVASISRGMIRTPAGTASVKLSKPVATRASVNARFREVKREISRNTKAVKKVDASLRRNTSIVSKRISRVSFGLRKSNRRLNAELKKSNRKLSADLSKLDKKMQEKLQLAMMLPLLQSKPKLDRITLDSDTTEETAYEVTDQTFQSEGNSLLFPLLLTMGDSGGGGSSNMMMMLALSGGLG